jgi:hypothetical protein
VSLPREEDLHVASPERCQTVADKTECRPHFKDAYSAHGRVVVANNSYYAQDFERGYSAGRLAEWDGSTGRPVSSYGWPPTELLSLSGKELDHETL